MEKDFFNLDTFKSIIEEKRVAELRDIFETIPLVDIAEVANGIEDPKDLIFIFRVVQSDYTAEFFSYLHKQTQEKLVAAFNDRELITLIESSYTDDIVDFIEDMPANVVNRILKNCNKETRFEVNRLLNYKEKTAGTIMTTEYIELINTMSVSEAIRLIRKRGKDAETVYTIFIRDEKRNFVGTVGLDALVLCKDENQIVSEIMNTDFVYVHVNTDQEEVANLFKRYGLTAIAVLNDDDRLTGIITVDDVMNVIEKEASEDMAKMSLITPLEESYIRTGVFKMAFKCIPWIVALMVLAVFSSMILSSFQTQLASLAILSVFIPVLIDTGGNAGGQTTTLMIRGLALKEFTPKDILKILWKEFRVSLVVSAAVSIFAFCWIMIEMYTNIVTYPSQIGGIPVINGVEVSGWNLFFARSSIAGLVALTLLFTVIISKIVGAILPLLFQSLKKDPALMSGPLITTIVDVCSLIAYFFICTQIFHLV